MGPTLVFSQFQVLLSHLWEFKIKKGRKEEEGIKKERRKEKKTELKKKKKKPPAGFKWVRSGQLVFMSVKWERVGGGIGFTLLPS